MLRNWLKTLLGFTVLLGLLDMLLPTGEEGKFARLVLGLAVMLVILQPLLELLQPNLDLPTLTGNLSTIDRKLEIQAHQLYVVGIRPLLENHSDLEALLLGETSVENVQIKREPGGFGQLKIRINPKNQVTENQVRATLSKYFNLTGNDILILDWNE